MQEIVRVRYYECDMQRVVHNAVYLAWCDDVADRLFRGTGVGEPDHPWDVMVKAATVMWTSPARLGDEIAIEVAPSRWGNTSFDLGFTGTRIDGDGDVFTATITYVAVRTHTTETVRVPDDFRAAFPAA